jgi:sarcosine oxidase
VVLVGPDEPVDKSSHQGVFASHYDEGRITRALDADGFWADVSRASIERYGEIESASGVRFFTGCGALMAGARGSDWLARVGEVREPPDRFMPDARRGLARGVPVPAATGRLRSVLRA